MPNTDGSVPPSDTAVDTKATNPSDDESASVSDSACLTDATGSTAGTVNPITPRDEESNITRTRTLEELVAETDGDEVPQQEQQQSGDVETRGDREGAKGVARGMDAARVDTSGNEDAAAMEDMEVDHEGRGELKMKVADRRGGHDSRCCRGGRHDKICSRATLAVTCSLDG